MRRTQIYIDEEDRRRLSRVARKEGVSFAEIVRRALAAFLRRQEPADDPDVLLDETLGALPDLEPPARGEWDRGHG